MKIVLNDGTVRECENKEEELHVLRHSAAHIMAQAIRRLFPEAIFAYGPATEKGFYYDVDLGDTKLTDADLANIEKEFGKGAVMKLGQNEGMNVEAISTGSLSLDMALGIGGVPRGRIVEIYGPESSGKTTIALLSVLTRFSAFFRSPRICRRFMPTISTKISRNSSVNMA